MGKKNEFYYDVEHQQLIGQGNWDLAHLSQLKLSIKKLTVELTKAKIATITVNGEHIKKMDSAGAWLLNNWHDKLKQQGIEVKFINFKKEYETLLAIVEKRLEEETEPIETPRELPFVPRLGKLVVTQMIDLNNTWHLLVN